MIQFVGPSSFESTIQCPAQTYYSKKRKNIVPRHPKIFFNTICHYVLEHIKKKHIIDASKLEILWDEELSKFNENLKQDQIESANFPLQNNLNNYYIHKKNFIYGIINNFKLNIDRITRQSKRVFLKEYALEIDGIKARIDLIKQIDDQIIICDYKFGKIFDDNGGIKPNYIKQMYIYAAMYYLKNNVIPKGLYLIDNHFNYHQIENKEISICIDYFNNLKRINLKLNEIGNSIDALAKPNDENCKYCNSKIYCESFWETKRFNPSQFQDSIRGAITRYKKINEYWYFELRNDDLRETSKINRIQCKDYTPMEDDMIWFFNIKHIRDNFYVFHKYSILIKKQRGCNYGGTRTTRN